MLENVKKVQSLSTSCLTLSPTAHPPKKIIIKKEKVNISVKFYELLRNACIVHKTCPQRHAVLTHLTIYLFILNLICR